MARPQRFCRACLILSLASVLIPDVHAETYTVGDDIGTWTVPATTNDLNYTIWSNARNFRFGDELVFRYGTSNHNVLLVNQSDYDICSVGAPLLSFSSGDDSITLNLPGVKEYYFICGKPANCFLGQKFHVMLVGLVPETPVVTPDAPPKSDASPSVSRQVKLALSAAFLMVSVSSLI